MLAGLAGGVLLLLRRLRGRDPAPREHSRRIVLYFSGVAVLLVALSVNADLRLRRIQARTERLTPAVEAYFRGETAEVPPLRIRECTRLARKEFEGGSAELRAECARGIGNWDQLLYRPGGNYPEEPITSKIGRWAYVWS